MIKKLAKQTAYSDKKHTASDTPVNLTKITTFIIFCVIALAITSCSKEDSSTTRTLTISGYRNYLPDNHPIPVSIAKFNEILEKTSKGKLKLQHVQPKIPNPMLQLENLRQAELDQETPDMMVTSVTGLADLAEEFNLLDIPFIAKNDAQIDALLDGDFGIALLNKLQGSGLIGLTYWENGFRQITNSKRPINRPEDFMDLKFRVIPKPVFVLPFEALGSTTHSMFFSKVYQALKTKEVDAQENYYSQILTAKLYEVQDYLSVTNHAHGSLTIVINESTWKELSEEEREMLQEAAIQAGKYQRDLNRKKAKSTLAKLAELGMTVNTVSQTELERMEQIMTPAAMELAKDYDPAIVELFNQTLNQIKELPPL